MRVKDSFGMELEKIAGLVYGRKAAQIKPALVEYHQRRRLRCLAVRRAGRCCARRASGAIPRDSAWIAWLRRTRLVFPCQANEFG